MCGIAGFLNTDGRVADPGVLTAMRDALAHRGPDGAGLFVDGAFGLGHRRLAIIDLREVAGQPMTSPDGRWTIGYNGELYNFRDLRPELEGHGWSFRTRSDTEVLLAAVAILGVEEAARRMNGMAAFAVWDAQDRRLHLVRDRFGTKPMYIWRAKGVFAFASEIKAFLKHPEFQAELNPAALREYFSFQNLFLSHTLFRDVHLLPPASILSMADGAERQTRYWDFDFSKREPIDEHTAVRRTQDLMAQAVTRQLVSDVPVGAYLSGGMDSGSLVALASNQNRRMQTFTAGFELSQATGIEATFDERRPAELMANAFGTEHFEQVINAGDIRWSLPKVVWHLEDLRLGMSYPNYYIARLASKFVKVCLSGAGGDELFGGYPWRYYHIFRSIDRTDYMRAHFDFWQRLTGPTDRARLLGDLAGTENEMFEVFQSVYAGTDRLQFDTPEDQIAAALYFECKTFLPGLLTIGDKLSMAHGLEERFPFLDNDLVDFACHLPISRKLSDLGTMLSIDEDGLKKKLQAQEAFGGGKSCLRTAMADLLPPNVIEQPKRGFSSPEASWYRGENAAYVRDMLLNGECSSLRFLDRGEIRRIVDEHLAGRRNHRLLIWSFLCFEQWCRIFLDGQPVAEH